MIQYPVRVETDLESPFAHIRDASNRVVASGLIGVDAHEIAQALNAHAAPRSRAKKQKIEDQLRASDLSGQLAERDNIEYGHHESLPRGEHVARARKA